MIPATAHFIWIGREFSWLSWAAIATAARHGGFDTVVLHHTHDLSREPHWQRLAELEKVVSERLNPAEAVERFGGPRLLDRYRTLSSPAAQSNVLRIALLAARGGVYLDLDTVTVADLSALRARASFFCGSERVAFPASVRRSRDPWRWAGAFFRSAVRDLVRRSSRGVGWFRRIEHHYPLAANNAVIGAEAGEDFLHELGGRMVRLSPVESQRRYALGTTLLQVALAEAAPPSAVVHSPEIFYPLGPEISTHWFRPAGRMQLGDVLSPATRVVHWYASVRTREIVPRIDSSWIYAEGSDHLLSALLRRALGGEASAS